MTFDPEQNRIPTGLLTDEERAALKGAKHGWQRYRGGDWIDTAPSWAADAIYRAIPLPTDADLLAEAMKLPEVAALLNTLETLRQEAWGYNINYETAFHAEVHDTLRDALAPFTAAKETP